MSELKTINIPPGISTLGSDHDAGPRWTAGDMVRFRNGLAQKIGGWQRGDGTFVGKCRALFDWRSNSQAKYIALGTNKKLYIWSGGNIYDITPIRTSGTLGLNPFSMTDTSAVVAVTHNTHGNSAGDYVHYSGATAAGGITIDGEYTVTAVTNANEYTITHSAAATSTTTGGGAAVAYQYEIHVGAEDSLYGTGYGTGGYGLSTYGTPRTTTTILFSARTWSLDNWGEDLIANPRGGGIYVWDSSVGTGTRATAMSGAPSTALFTMTFNENRHVMAFGAHDGAADDPLNTRWCTSEDYTDWTPAETNTAGDKRLDGGNELICAVKAKGESVVYSNFFMWSMVFTGPPDQFTFKPIGTNGGILGPNAVVEMDGAVYWLGYQDFYVYDGAVRVIPCEVHNHVFDDFNFVQKAKVHAHVNRLFGEIWWFYCSAGSAEIDKYVILNVRENLWSIGSLVRTAAVGDSDLFDVPYAAGADGYLYDHDTGTDNDVAAAITAYLESGGIEIVDGEAMMLIDRFVPDFETLTGSVDVTFKAKRYPQSSETISDTTLNITSATELARPRVKGRQMSVRIESNDLLDHWRFGGALRIGVKPYGKRL